MEASYSSGLSAGTYTWDSWKTHLSSNALFKGDPTYLDPNQGAAETCYFVASISAAGEWPSLIKDMFITGTDDSSIGLYGVKFYIRGRPWVVHVDDKLLFESGSLKYMKVADNGAMWAAILEKAWAKAKGNYAQTDGGFVVSGLRSITGAPVFTYSPSSSTYTYTSDQSYTLLEAANTANYMMGAGTASGSN